MTAPIPDRDDVLRVLRELQRTGEAKPMAGAIAKRLPWGTHGSDKRLNDALQALRTSGEIRYVKGTGWIEVTS